MDTPPQAESKEPFEPDNDEASAELTNSLPSLDASSLDPASYLSELGERSRLLRLEGQYEQYESAAAELLSALNELNILKIPAARIKILQGGRVNYLCGETMLDGQRLFLKICPPGIEDAVYRAIMRGQINTNGRFFFIPSCQEIYQADNISIFLLQHLDNMHVGKSASEDALRIIGLGEFSHLNQPTTKIDQIPSHRLIIRESSVSRMQTSLGLNHNSAEVKTQETIVSNWNLIEKRLRNTPVSLCVRDSHRGNVAIFNSKAAICDVGAVHYAPIGFDLWSFLAEDEETSDSTLAKAVLYQAALSTSEANNEPHELYFVACAAACIMCLDTFVGNSYYGNIMMVRKLQRRALSLIDST